MGSGAVRPHMKPKAAMAPPFRSVRTLRCRGLSFSDSTFRFGVFGRLILSIAVSYRCKWSISGPTHDGTARPAKRFSPRLEKRIFVLAVTRGRQLGLAAAH